jgi:hypothetical protein
MNRTLSPEFMTDLQEGGRLHPLLERIQKDSTLMLAIRENYINVYYRGGNIIRLEENKAQNQYKASFDENYAKEFPNSLPDPFPTGDVVSSEHIGEWIKSIPALKQVMDFYFQEIKEKTEREFQQLVVRENNYSPIANGTEYFIADIELTNADIGARFDMLAFKWPASDRKSGKVQLSLIEMKYGDEALKKKSGIVEHFNQMSTYLTNDLNCAAIADMATEQINQLNQLGLLRHKKGEAREFEVDDSKFEIIFIFANHNPRATTLLEELNKLKELCSSTPKEAFDLRFFVASTAGYGMHQACMMDIDGYIKFIEDIEKGTKKGTEG